MPRTRFALPAAATAIAALALSASALAESQTMGGQGDLKKMTADNGRKAVSVKLFGFKGPCQAKQFSIEIFWGKKPAYQVQAGCYGGTKWGSGLYYAADRADGYSNNKVRCGEFSLKYTKSKTLWHAIVPRSCLSKAADRVRIKAEGINYAGSAMPGMAGPTRRLRRG